MNAIKHGNYSEIGKAISYFEKNTKEFSKIFTKQQVKDAFKNFVPDAIQDKIIDDVKKSLKNEKETG